jgi:hypothetical protein
MSAKVLLSTNAIRGLWGVFVSIMRAKVVFFFDISKLFRTFALVNASSYHEKIYYYTLFYVVVS